MLWYCGWLLCHDKNFLEAHRHAEAEVFPRGSLSYLVALAFKQRQALSPTLVAASSLGDTANLRRHRTTSPAVCQAFDLLEAGYAIPDADLSAMRELCGEWLKKRSLRVGVDAALGYLDQGAIDKARQVIAAADYAVEEREDPVRITIDTLIQDPGLVNDLIRRKPRKADAIPLGLDDLDKAWHGGTRGGELGIILGPTGTGKSMWLCMIAAQAFWSGRFVLYYTSELTTDQIRERISLAIVEMGKYDFASNKEWSDYLIEEAKRRKVAFNPVQGYEVREGQGMSMPELRAALEAFKQDTGHYPGLLILDDPTDMLPPGHYEKAYEGFKAMFTYLRSLAQELNIPVWVSGQATREQVGMARASLRRIGDAYAKAHKAHFVIGLAQAEDQKNDPDGPFMKAFVLKDSIWGTPGAEVLVKPHFGDGDNGWPGVNVQRVLGLNISTREVA